MKNMSLQLFNKSRICSTHFEVHAEEWPEKRADLFVRKKAVAYTPHLPVVRCRRCLPEGTL